jgi:hypothetical protein
MYEDIADRWMITIIQVKLSLYKSCASLLLFEVEVAIPILAELELH